MLTLLLSLMRLAAIPLLAFLPALRGLTGPPAASKPLPRGSREESAPEWRGRSLWLPLQTTITWCLLRLSLSLSQPPSRRGVCMGSHVSSTQAREQAGKLVRARRRTVSSASQRGRERDSGGLVKLEGGTVGRQPCWSVILHKGGRLLAALQHSSCTADSYKIPQLALLAAQSLLHL